MQFSDALVLRFLDVLVLSLLAGALLLRSFEVLVLSPLLPLSLLVFFLLQQLSNRVRHSWQLVTVLRDPIGNSNSNSTIVSV